MLLLHGLGLCHPNYIISNHLSQKYTKTFEELISYKAYVNSTHVDPQSFHQIYRWYLMAISHCYHLSYGEIVSLQTTFDFMLKSHYYLGVVCESFLRMDVNVGNRILSFHQGYALGYFIFSIMHEMKDRFLSPPGRLIIKRSKYPAGMYGRNW